MKRILILLALTVCACSQPFNPAKKAARLVFRHYPDCEKILMVDVDTVTLGDNLEYRIKQQQEEVEYAENDVRMYRRWVKEFRSTKSVADDYRKRLHDADSILNRKKLRLSALDSLKAATLDIADMPTAYQVCVAYNYPSNLVWIQMDEDGTLLKISKSIMDLFFNPGGDMPGYFEIIEKYR